MNIIIYGAFDRHNYGDLLFPIIVKKFVEAHSSISPIVAATKDSDLSEYGALKSVSLAKVLAKMSADEKAVIIVAGGEVLSAEWGNILAYLAPRWAYYGVRALSLILGGRRFASLCKLLTGINSDLPFVVDPCVMPGIEVKYNAVGGNRLNTIDSFSSEAAIRILKNASYISVRDEITSNELAKNDIQHSVYPDCAVLLSDFYPKSELPISEQNYLVFQISAHFANGHIQEIVEQLVKLHQTSGLRIALVSIGKAPGHSDDSPLGLIYKELGDISFLVNGGRIEDIVSVIAGSSLYCGTSLHGAITAISYGVPQLALFPDLVVKLSAFLETWAMPSTYELTEIEGLAEAALTLLNSQKPSSEIAGHIQSLKDLASENFSRQIKAYI